MTQITVHPLPHEALMTNVDALGHVLIETVADGAAISFLHPVSPDVAHRFWLEDVGTEVAAGRRTLFGAFVEDALVGSVQVITAMPPNQPHRAEIAKMMVHPSARRQGLGRRLMLAALDHARALGKTLITLDTRTGDVAQSLYASVGFKEAGIIPDFALDPDGRHLHPTTYMFKRL